MFVEEMKMLFRRADPEMAEEKKLRLLMRGVKQELFAGMVRNPPNTVNESVSEASMMVKTLDMRSRQYDRQSVSIMAKHTDDLRVPSDTRRETIRTVVREELRKLFPMTP